MHQFSTHNYFMVPFCRQLLCALSNQKGEVTMYSSDDFHPSLICINKRLWVSGSLSLPVLIAQTEWQTLCTCMNSFFPSLASVKKRTYTLHRWFIFITWIPYNTAPFIHKKTSRSRVYNNRGYFCVLYMCFPMCADERYCSPNVFYRLVPPLRTLKVTPSFPAKDTWA